MEYLQYLQVSVFVFFSLPSIASGRNIILYLSLGDINEYSLIISLSEWHIILYVSRLSIELFKVIASQFVTYILTSLLFTLS